MYFGGKDVKNKCSDTLYVLHTVRREWNRPTILGHLPAPRHSHAACVIGTTMYIFGGQFNGYYLNDIAAFNMKTLNTANPKWERLEPTSELPPARAGHCAASHDGKIYIFGGADDQFFYNDIWCYDPQVNKWEAVPAFGVLPTSRQGHAATVIDDTMYIFGGMNHEDQLLGDLSAFKFNDRRWLTFPDTMDSASPRTEHAMCSVGDRVYILGGQLELNADEDPGTIYILDTTKIRYHDPSSMGSLRSAYESDAGLRISEGGPAGADELNASFQPRRSPTPQEHQHQQQYPGHRQSPQNSTAGRFMDDANSSNMGSPQQPLRRSLDGLSSGAQINSATNRRTLGKTTSNSTGFVAHEVEPRATQSIDETRHRLHHHYQAQQQQQQQLQRAELNDGDFYEREGHSRSQSQGQLQRPTQFSNGVHIGQQQQQDSSRRRSSSESRHRGSYNPALRPSLDRARSPVQAQTQPHPQQQPQDASLQSELQQQQYYPSKDAEIADLRQREQWLLAEVALARKKMGAADPSSPNASSSPSLRRPLSNLGLSSILKEELLSAYDADQDSEKYRILQALLAVKTELERSKTSIVAQAQVASTKMREAERVRTAALQEAAYLKAKVSALQSGETAALVATETARARDLEKRLTVALATVDKLTQQTSHQEMILERERNARKVAQDREREASLVAEEVQVSHTRSLVELASLHERASSAEAALRECEAKMATSEAGLSSYQQQSTALFSQINGLKTTVEHQKKSLEKAKLAYSVANERAEHADRAWSSARSEIDQVQLEFAGVRADLERAQRESEHWRTKAKDTELLWQKAKGENEAMRALLEEEMNSAASYGNSGSGNGSPVPGGNIRKHDSIMAITSASRVAELEHELGTLRQLLRESQAAAAQANKDLGETMVRISQLEQSAMTARAEAATAQRQLTASEDKCAGLEAQLRAKEEALEEMAKEQENNEVQLGVLRGVMRENGLLADDLILEALSQEGGGDAKVPMTMVDLKAKVEESEQRVQELEQQLESLNTIKKQQEERIQQLEADYQTAVHYVQGSETVLQRLRDEVQVAKNEKESVQTTLHEMELTHAKALKDAHHQVTSTSEQLEEEVSNLHQQLHESMGRSMELEQRLEELSRTVQESEAAAEATHQELRTLKSKHHEHKKQGAIAVEGYQTKINQLETLIEEMQASLAETKDILEKRQFELEKVHQQNKTTGQELEEAIAQLKVAKESSSVATDKVAAQSQDTTANSRSSMDDADAQKVAETKVSSIAEAELEAVKKTLAAAHREDLELVIENAQKSIRSLEAANQDLEQQLRASENKISILLDNFQGLESARNSTASLTGGVTDENLIWRLMEANHHYLPSAQVQANVNSPDAGTRTGTHLAPMSHGSHLTDRSSADSFANELELLRSNWGQTHFQMNNDLAYRTTEGVVEGEEGEHGDESSMIAEDDVHADAATGAISAPSSSAPSSSTPSSPAIDDTFAAEAATPAAIITTTATSTTQVSPSSTMSSAQKLEEYEKMIEDMTNARRSA
ncbi:Negative regulator of mitotic exit [Haplosporangium sp. Z 767]|nr:Negative regulator of mitotic exit [Haplosporangium sp. Z 767]